MLEFKVNKGKMEEDTDKILFALSELSEEWHAWYVNTEQKPTTLEELLSGVKKEMVEKLRKNKDKYMRRDIEKVLVER